MEKLPGPQSYRIDYIRDGKRRSRGGFTRNRLIEFIADIGKESVRTIVREGSGVKVSKMGLEKFYEEAAKLPPPSDD